MVQRLQIEAGDNVTNATVNDFLALATAEQQLIFVFDQVVAAQQTYNDTDPVPDPQLNRVAVQPSASGIGAQMRADLTETAPTSLIYDATTTIGAGETAIAIEAGDTVTNADMNTFLGLTLAGQVVFLASLIQSAESAYNTANPETPANVISITPNYDLNSVAVSALFPLAGSGNAGLVGALAF
jgi:hypothetical protein